jgi:hypothetical protein
MELAHFMMNASGYRCKLLVKISNYCFATATVVAQTRLIITLHVSTFSVCLLFLWGSLVQHRGDTNIWIHRLWYLGKTDMWRHNMYSSHHWVSAASAVISIGFALVQIFTTSTRLRRCHGEQQFRCSVCHFCQQRHEKSLLHVFYRLRKVIFFFQRSVCGDCWTFTEIYKHYQ